MIKTTEQELRDELATLDEKAEACGASDVRQMITVVLEDIREPAGKENARMAIREIRDILKEFKSGRHSETRNRFGVAAVPAEMDYDDVVA